MLVVFLTLAPGPAIIYKCMYVCMYIYMFMYIYMYVCMYVCISIYVCVYKYMYVCMYIYIHSAADSRSRMVLHHSGRASRRAIRYSLYLLY